MQHYCGFYLAIVTTSFFAIVGAVGSIHLPIMTFDQLVESEGIHKDLLDRECSNKHLWKIASLLPDWVMFAKALGLTELQIQDILQKQHLTTSVLKALEALEKWHQQHAFNATYHHLIEVCLELKFVSVAVEICKIVNGQSQFIKWLLQWFKQYFYSTDEI